MVVSVPGSNSNEPGMIFTIEPMINAGKAAISRIANDGWTIVTKDRSLSAQWEHTVLVTSPASRSSRFHPAARACAAFHAALPGSRE